MRKRSILFLLFVPMITWAQQPVRPIPYPIFTSPQFEAAIAKGTRTKTGIPGSNYWTNSANYVIETELDPASKLITSSATIQYINNSPNDLPFLIINLRQNLYKPTAFRNRPIPFATDGMNITETKVLTSKPGESEQWAKITPQVSGTQMRVSLPQPLKAKQNITLQIKWSFTLPERSFRMGHDKEVYIVAYWFPQLAVYDDVRGWDSDQYIGNGEFYNDFGDYDVKITVPKGYLVSGTGTLQNPAAVLDTDRLARLREAASQDSVVHVLTKEERDAGNATLSTSDKLTWHFKAEKVRDFTWATSDKYIWDATRAAVGDLNKDGKTDYSMIHAFYRPEKTVWKQSAKYARFSIEHLSQRYIPYPWPHMSTIEGFIGGGMEFPMLTHIGGSRTPQALFGVTYHEIAHMWFPMMVGVDEKSFCWAEEGVTTYNENDGYNAFFPKENAWDPKINGYFRIAGTGNEIEIGRHTDNYPITSPARGIAAYDKPATLLRALGGVIGHEKVIGALREYANRWAFKYPYDQDFFNTFEDVLGKDMDWFWTSGWFTTWTLDHGVQSVTQKGKKTTIVIEDNGNFPMMTLVEVTYTNGQKETLTLPVTDWLKGSRTSKLEVSKGVVQKVEIDPQQTSMDLNRANNVWTKK
ncbi:MAG TPA: M1 family metallopeptidase [Rhodothermales bacterium]|nr:M1 family metallopeptidase [Rhodothermales bacterium]